MGNQKKDLKYYWENRYGYIEGGYFKCVNFIKNNKYLWAKRIVLFLLVLIIGKFYKEGVPSNNLVLIASFFTATFVSILFFLFLTKNEFLKKMIMFVCLHCL